MKLKELTHTIKEHISVYPGTDTLKLQNCDGSPIRAITWFEYK